MTRKPTPQEVADMLAQTSKHAKSRMPAEVAAVMLQREVQQAIYASFEVDTEAVLEAPEAVSDASEELGWNPLASLAPNAPSIAVDPEKIDPSVQRWCAALDHSDTDNAARLISHFGRDLLVLRQTNPQRPRWVIWAGDHWDADTGAPRVLAIAQRLGARIAAEVQLLDLSDDERQIVANAASLEKKAKLSPSQRQTIDLAKEIQAGLLKRKSARAKHAVTSKNSGRLESMLKCLAPHVMRDPVEFNHDPLMVATRSHTLAFKRTIKLVVEHPGGPDLEREVEIADAELSASAGHRRSDLITQVLPLDYDAKADCPAWRAFLRQMLPNDDVRHMVQVASGLGLLGITVQKLFFHYGAGANGKSVYLETLCRILGGLAITLPSSSFIGEGSSSGQATPDIARLYGRRFLRVKEMPEGEDLRENLVKESTGGEVMSARDLFSGYFDFAPIFTSHMSGNGFPRITGTDEGIWRRMAVVHWPVQIPVEARVPFEDMLARFVPEYPGILNWLIEGALIYLREGLRIPSNVTASTAEMRFEMDPTAQFCRDCVVADDAGSVRGGMLYDAYVRHVEEQSGAKYARPISIQRFGRIMKKKYAWGEERGTIYRIRLVDVPVRSPHAEGYGGLP